MRRAVLPRRLDLSGGEAGGEAGGERTVIATAGGVSHKQRGGVSHPPRPYFPIAVRVFRPRPSFSIRASGEGKDGSDPPLCAAGADRQRGGYHTGYHTRYHTPPPPMGGLSRLNVSLREGSDARPGMAHHPGALALYRRGHFRSRRVRQDLRVYAPVRPPTLELARRQSRAARGRACARSEGGSPSRHPPDARRARPRR